MKKAPYHRLVVTVFSRVAWAKARSFGPFLRPHFAGCRSFLDVGCGDGIVTRHLMDTHPRNEFVGLDVIDYRVTDIPMELYNGLQFPFPDRHFDCVYAISCLHHCSDENAVLREMIRVARTRLIVVEEIYDGFWEKAYLCLHDWIANRLESGAINVPFHFHTESEWRAMVASAGGRIEKWEPVCPLPVWLRVLLLTLTRHRLFVVEKPEPSSSINVSQDE